MAPPRSAPDLDPSTRETLSQLVLNGQRLGAIKVYRETTGQGRGEAENYLDGLEHDLRSKHPERFTPEGRLAAVPWVGLWGDMNTIAVDRDGRRTVCRLAHTASLLILVVLFALGPGGIAALWFKVGNLDLRDAPRPVVALFWLAALGITLLFLKYLFRHRRLEIDRLRGEIQFFARRSGPPAIVVKRRDIATVEVSAVPWLDLDTNRIRTFVHVLAVGLRDGTSRGLCLSTYRDLIDELAEDVRSLAGIDAPRT